MAKYKVVALDRDTFLPYKYEGFPWGWSPIWIHKAPTYEDAVKGLHDYIEKTEGYPKVVYQVETGGVTK